MLESGLPNTGAACILAFMLQTCSTGSYMFSSSLLWVHLAVVVGHRAQLLLLYVLL
jgi:hypothetical protein